MSLYKSFFASANTGKGFVNQFNAIDSGNGFQYILKGAPGCGKNSLMRKIAERYSSRDVHIEYFYCSSDPDSLDGVRIVEPDISVVDGTAPHVTECRFDGLTHKIVNMGAAVLPGLEAVREELIFHETEKKRGYALLYKYLSSALSLMDADLMKMPVKDIPADTVRLPESAGHVRHTFLSSVERDLTGANVWSEVIMMDMNARSADSLFHRIEDICATKGLSLTCILNTIDPNVYDAIYIAETDTLYKAVPVSDPILDELGKRAAEQLATNRRHHLGMEKAYHGYINYEVVNSISESLLSELCGSGL